MAVDKFNHVAFLNTYVLGCTVIIDPINHIIAINFYLKIGRKIIVYSRFLQTVIGMKNINMAANKCMMFIKTGYTSGKVKIIRRFTGLLLIMKFLASFFTPIFQSTHTH